MEVEGCVEDDGIDADVSEKVVEHKGAARAGKEEVEWHDWSCGFVLDTKENCTSDDGDYERGNYEGVLPGKHISSQVQAGNEEGY